MSQAKVIDLMEALRDALAEETTKQEPRLELKRLESWLVAHPQLWHAMSGSPVDVAIVIMSRLL